MRAALLLLALCGLNLQAQTLYRCEVGGKLEFRQSPCPEGGKPLRVHAPPVGTVTPRAPSASAPSAASTPAPDADASALGAIGPDRRLPPEWLTACLDWYRPLLRDPDSAKAREPSRERGVLSLTLQARNARGGLEEKPARCEFKSDRLDAGWTRIHAERLGWNVKGEACPLRERPVAPRPGQALPAQAPQLVLDDRGIERCRP
ncbi:hypothetical protein HNQ51_002263 [Inhella inkyongensis]|uniref:DUF4124 domain-containing protein n=1 Tax=Inhella inkyongensis TaxID=392593 RepID=A0A840S823_9BURK|nr:hypothetical protein [Inhella inkyongensis]MBB5204944.1 hypothetical protein [Inhella inkyongensis]